MTSHSNGVIKKEGQMLEFAMKNCTAIYYDSWNPLLEDYGEKKESVNWHL